jgi:predicted Zn-ribbon and HTH transcriptional regulator
MLRYAAYRSFASGWVAEVGIGKLRVMSHPDFKKMSGAAWKSGGYDASARPMIWLPAWAALPGNGWIIDFPLWIPWALAAGFTAWRFRADRVMLPDACPECGYDKRGLDAAAPCPECGALASSNESSSALSASSALKLRIRVRWGMRWTRARAGLKWTLAGLAVAVAALCPLTRWLKGQWVVPAGSPTLGVSMAGESLVFNYQKDGFGPGLAPSQLWWDSGPVQWNFWFHGQHMPNITQLVIPMWTLAALPGLGALLVWRSERPERRRRLGLCLQCGYERRGLAVAAPCPECGAGAGTVVVPGG